MDRPSCGIGILSSAGWITLRPERLLAPGGVWRTGCQVVVEDGRIAALEEATDVSATRLEGGCLTPGLIDVHNNGAFGVDFATAGPADWFAARAQLAACAVTSVQPTLITAPLADLVLGLSSVAAAMDRPEPAPVARVLGAHLEGPFLSPARRGAHRADWIAEPRPDRIESLLSGPAARALRTVTLAPELPGALDAIKRLTRAGVVVSLGHSDADAAWAQRGYDAGAMSVTHLFNAMRPLGHRDPGLAGVSMTRDGIFCCLIVDGIHVDPLMCRIAFASTGKRMVAVTDSIALAGLQAGRCLPFGGAPAMLGADSAARRPDGTLAGAGIVLDEGVRRMIAAGIAPADILLAATEAPARMLGRDDLGRLAPGAWADMIWWDEAWVPRRVWIGGREIMRDV